MKVFNYQRHVVTELTTGKATFHLEVRHLKSHGNYCLEVAALNRIGFGPLSNDYCIVIDDGGGYMDPYARPNVLFILRTSMWSIPWYKSVRWLFSYKCFVKPYQTSKAPASCFGAGEIFVKRENWQIFQFTRQWPRPVHSFGKGTLHVSSVSDS